MTLNERQQQMMEQLNAWGEIKVIELKDRFDVTEMTIRRDLEKLEKLGLAKRTFGGAILASKDVALQERTTLMAEQKQRIGRLAASLVQSGDSIFIDGGTTTLEVARHLPVQAQITVVTNAINVAAVLAERKIPTIVAGGVLVETTNSMVGPMAVETISRMAFDKIFLGSTGINPEHGYSNSNMYEAEIKRFAIQKTKEAYVVMDHTKFGARVLFSFAELSQVYTLITDQMPESDLVNAIQSTGSEILVADSKL